MYRPGLKLRSAYTLVEILVATTLSLMLMGALVQMFSKVGEGITDSRAMLETADRLRLAQTRLQMDLAGITVTMQPPRKPEFNEGYFEYIEGPVGAAQISDTSESNILLFNPAINSDLPPSVTFPNNIDTTVGDYDDILMFTTRSKGRPFVGRYNNTTIQSDVAEIAWFVRGRTLHRRVLLVAPRSLAGVLNPYYANCDISASNASGNWVANTLGDLTKRENRFAHATALSPIPWHYRSVMPSGWKVYRPSTTWQPATSYTTGTVVTPSPKNGHYYICIQTGESDSSQPIWPVDGSQVVDNTVIWKDQTQNWLDIPTLPTLRESSSQFWPVVVASPPVPTLANGLLFSESRPIDFWSNNPNYNLSENALTASAGVSDGVRISDDIILTNVIGFDVKGWAPNLGFMNFDYASGYDTSSTSHEDPQASNGFDDNNNGIVDDDAEKIYTSPHTFFLRGIQVKIRVFEPDSRQIREVTVVQDFLPQ